MSKPGSVPTWDSNGTNSTVPSAGKQTDGWPAGPTSPVISSYLNYWMNLVYLWTAWLNGLWDGSGNLTLDSNASVTVSGTGAYKHGTRTISLPLGPIHNAATESNGLTTAAISAYTPAFLFAAASYSAVRDICLPVGARILAVRARILDSTASATIALVSRASGASAIVTVATSAASAANATEQTIAASGLTTTIVALSRYWVYLARGNGATDNLTVYTLEVDYDQP